MLLASLVDQTRTKIDRGKKCGEKFHSTKIIYDEFSSEINLKEKKALTASLNKSEIKTKKWFCSLF